MSTVTVLRGPERRRRWSIAEKLRIVEECAAEGTAVADVARRHDVHPNLLHLWRRQARTGELSGPASAGAQFAPVALAARETLASGGESEGARGGMIELLLRNGRVLRLSDGVSPVRLAQLVEALEGGRP